VGATAAKVACGAEPGVGAGVIVGRGIARSVVECAGELDATGLVAEAPVRFKGNLFPYLLANIKHVTNND